MINKSRIRFSYTFFIPIAGVVQVNIIGQLYLHEVFLFSVFLYHLFASDVKFKRPVQYNIILTFSILWLLSLMYSDLYRSTEFIDLARGWAKIIFFISSFVALVFLLRTPNQIFWWLIGSVVLQLVRSFEWYQIEPDFAIAWKFGFGSALLKFMLLLKLSDYESNKNNQNTMRWLIALPVVFGVGSFFLNARSLAALSLTGGLLAYMFFRYRGRHVSYLTILGVLGLLLAFASIVGQFYSWGASTGYFGEDSRRKYESQLSSNDGFISLVLGGRSEALVSTIAISDSPIIGHGSWAKDFKYVQLLQELKYISLQVEDNPVVLDQSDGQIPSHSFLLGAWVEAGLFGGVFWIVVLLIVIFSVMPSSLLHGGALGYYLIVFAPAFLWDILFSPFGATVRVEVAGLLALAVMQIYCSNSRNN